MKLNKELDLISNLQQAHNFSVNEQVDEYEQKHNGILGTEVLTEEWFKMAQLAYIDLSDSIERAIETMKMIAGIGIQEENSAEVVSEILLKHYNAHVNWSNDYGESLGGWAEEKDMPLKDRNEHLETMYDDLMEIISATIKEAQRIDTEYEVTFYNSKEEMMGGMK